MGGLEQFLRLLEPSSDGVQVALQSCSCCSRKDRETHQQVTKRRMETLVIRQVAAGSSVVQAMERGEQKPPKEAGNRTEEKGAFGTSSRQERKESHESGQKKM